MHTYYELFEFQTAERLNSRSLYWGPLVRIYWSKGSYGLLETAASIPEMIGRDAVEDQQLAEILAELPAKHPARTAFARNRATVQIMYLLIGEPLFLARVGCVHNEGLERQKIKRQIVSPVHSEFPASSQASGA